MQNINFANNLKLDLYRLGNKNLYRKINKMTRNSIDDNPYIYIKPRTADMRVSCLLIFPFLISR